MAIIYHEECSEWYQSMFTLQYLVRILKLEMAVSLIVFFSIVSSSTFPHKSFAEKVNGVAEPSFTVESGTADEERRSIQKLRSLLAQSQNYTAEFRQVLHNTQGVAVEQSKGTISLSQPDKLRWDITDPMEQTLIVNGADFYQYDSDIDQLIVETLSGQLSHLSGLLLVADEAELAIRYKVKEIRKIFSNADQKTPGSGKMMFTLTPKQKDGLFAKLLLEFNADTLFAIEVEDDLGENNRFSFTSIETGADIPASTFQLDVPEGTDIIRR